MSFPPRIENSEDTRGDFASAASGVSGGTNQFPSYTGPHSFPSELTSVGGKIFFTANDGTNGRELWTSDGTAAGTVLGKDIGPFTQDASASLLTNVNGTLFFTANNSTNGQELWKNDGTGAGTVLVKDLASGSAIGAAGPLSNANGLLYFRGNDGFGGSEFWKSDGSEAGTVPVRHIRQGTYDSNPQNFTNVNGMLFFTADDGVHGEELWQSDGTEAGTVLVEDIAIGGDSSGPNQITLVGNRLSLAATTIEFGREVWSGVLNAPTVDGDFNDYGRYDVSDIDSLIAAIAVGTNSIVFDLTGDGRVNLDDRDAWLAEAGAIKLASGNPYLIGDANLDGVVDVSDFNLWNANKFTTSPRWSVGEFNGDGVVDVSDFNLWKANKFRSSDNTRPGGLPTVAPLKRLLVIDEVKRSRSARITFDEIFAYWDGPMATEAPN